MIAGCTGREEPAQFTIRGRWPDPMRITWRCETANSPIGAEAFEQAIYRASQQWNDTRVIGLHPAVAGATADVTLSWQRGAHGACEPFGPSTDVGHTGLVATGTFVHFDLGRSWNGRGLSLVDVAAHELGHVLGLGHTDAAAAVMSTSPARPGKLSRHDLAGLHSLYGGGVDGPGDLRVVQGSTVVCTLRGVAPPSLCDFAVFDTDGDGRDEVVVWRTDAEGHGALQSFHFARGPRLFRTQGPFAGAVVPGTPVGFVTGPAGERLVTCDFATGRRVVRQFDQHGVPDLPAAEHAAGLAKTRTQGDLDGDGVVESLLPRSR